MKRFVCICLIYCIGVQWLSAQSTRQFGNASKGVVYEKEFAVNLRLHTNGLAFGAHFGQLKTYYKTTYFHIGLGEIRHPKEFKQSFDLPGVNPLISARSYVYGKQNNLYVLRGGYGIKRYLSEKARRKGVAVGISYEFGPSIGLVKPYYLEINDSDSSRESNQVTTKSEKFTPETVERFLSEQLILGSSGFSTGLSEISLLPGVQAKAAIHLDWGAFDEFVRGVEAGLMVDVYFRRVPIMVDDALVQSLSQGSTSTINIEPRNVQNRPFFINFFLNFQIGRRR